MFPSPLTIVWPLKRLTYDSGACKLAKAAYFCKTTMLIRSTVKSSPLLTDLLDQDSFVRRTHRWPESVYSRERSRARIHYVRCLCLLPHYTESYSLINISITNPEKWLHVTSQPEFRAMVAAFHPIHVGPAYSALFWITDCCAARADPSFDEVHMITESARGPTRDELEPSAWSDWNSLSIQLVDSGVSIPKLVTMPTMPNIPRTSWMAAPTSPSSTSRIVSGQAKLHDGANDMSSSCRHHEADPLVWMLPKKIQRPKEKPIQ